MSQTLFMIGAGVIARLHAHATAKLGEPVRIFVTDPSAAAIEQFTREFPQAIVCESVGTMLAKEPSPDDIVIIATPPSSHAELTIAALRSGRHVLCEKPLAMDVAQAKQMLDVAKQQRRLLGCCSTRFLGLPATEEVRRMIKEHLLGDIYHMTFVNRWPRRRSGIEYQPESRWFLDITKSGGGVLMDWGPYDIASMVDLFRPRAIAIATAWIARPITQIDPTDIKLETEQHFAAAMTLELNDGRRIPVSYERAVCTHGHEISMVEVEGTLGAARWDWLGTEGKVSRTLDVNGKLETRESMYPDETGLIWPIDRCTIF